MDAVEPELRCHGPGTAATDRVTVPRVGAVGACGGSAAAARPAKRRRLLPVLQSDTFYHGAYASAAGPHSQPHCSEGKHEAASTATAARSTTTGDANSSTSAGGSGDAASGDTAGDFGAAGSQKRSRSAAALRRLKALNAGHFYTMARARAIEQRCKRAKHGAETYAEFPTQAMAFVFADRRQARAAAAPAGGGANTSGDDPAVAPVKVFSVEVGPGGRRRYAVACRTGWWRRYARRAPADRHAYEIIREGTPCHLYFDIEYLRAHNPSAAPERLMTTFMYRVAAHIHALFDVTVSRDDCVELDSSTPRKFSRHVTVHIPGPRLFRDNHHAGRFVASLVASLQAERGVSPPVERLWLNDARGGKHFFADLAVYTRNRAMRLFLSSKHGKEARLRASSGLHYSTPELPASCQGVEQVAAIRQALPVPARNRLDRAWMDASCAQGYWPPIDVTPAPTATDVDGNKADPGKLEAPLPHPRAVPSSSATACKPDPGAAANNRPLGGGGSGGAAREAFSAVSVRVGPRNAQADEDDDVLDALLSSMPLEALLAPEAARRVLAAEGRVPAGTPGDERAVAAGGDNEAPGAATHGGAGAGLRGDGVKKLGGGVEDGGGMAGAVVEASADGAQDQGGHDTAEARQARWDAAVAAWLIRPGVPAGASLLPAVELDAAAAAAARVAGIRAHNVPAGGGVGAPWLLTRRHLGGGRGSGSGRGGGGGAVEAPHHGPSPLPRLDGFVRSLATRGGVVGGIRSWTARAFDGDAAPGAGEHADVDVAPGARGSDPGAATKTAYASISYHISRNRWCANVGRPHRSNHIVLVADLRYCCVFQTCMDPECRSVGFRSDAVPIPPPVLATFPREQLAVSLVRRGLEVGRGSGTHGCGDRAPGSATA